MKTCYNASMPIRNDSDLPARRTLENENIYSASYNRCCKYGEECILDSITDYENELLNQVKIKSSKYKMVFTKNDNSFVYKEVRK